MNPLPTWLRRAVLVLGAIALMCAAMFGSAFAYYAAQDGQNDVLSPIMVAGMLPQMDIGLEDFQSRLADGETIRVVDDRTRYDDPRPPFEVLRFELDDTAEGKAVEAALRDTLMSTIPSDAGARYGYWGWTDHLFTGPGSDDAIAEIRGQFHSLYPELPNWLDGTFKTARRGAMAMLAVLIGLCLLSAIIAWTTARRRFGVLAGMIIGMSVLSAGLALLQTQHSTRGLQGILPEAQTAVRSNLLSGYLYAIEAQDDGSIADQLDRLPLDIPAELANMVRNPGGNSAYAGDPLDGRVTRDGGWSRPMEASDIAAIQTFIANHDEYQFELFHYGQARYQRALQPVAFLLCLANVLLVLSLILAGVAALARRAKSDSNVPLQS